MSAVDFFRPLSTKENAAMDSGATDLREELYRVIGHYTQLSEMARQGEINPMSQIGKIVKKRFPFLLLVISEIIPQLERDQITYQQALFILLEKAMAFGDQDLLLESRDEIQEIETDGAAFIYSIRWVDKPKNLRPMPAEVEKTLRNLRDLNTKYRKRYAPDDEDTTTIIPFFLRKEEASSTGSNLDRVTDLVNKAVLELHHLMMEYESSRKFFGLVRSKRTEIVKDLMHLSWFLFRCGYSVDRIVSGYYYKDALTELLNGKLLDYLIETENSVDGISGLSWHLAVMCMLNIGSFFEVQGDYRDLDDRKEVARHVKALKSKNRRGGELLKKLANLDKIYGSRPQGLPAQNFLRFRYYSSFQDYHGERRTRDPKGETAVRVYKPIVDPEAMEKRAQQDLQEKGRCFSSKTQEEMNNLLTLLVDSLNNPARVTGKRVKILGDISSGAMGEVSIGIFRDEIVALKRVKEGVTGSLGDPVALLEYEAALHRRVQSPDQHPFIVEYYDFIEQETTVRTERLLINGYHPNDNLTQLVEKNWREKFKPPFSVRSKLTLATLEIVFLQLLECVKRFREKGVVHRDLKTDNILYMVDENETVNRIKVIDFGVGLAIGSGAVEDLFRGKIVGTFSYMAPEQAKGKSDFQSDLYSAGAIFTVLLTGRLPLVFPKTHSREELVKQIMRIEREPRPKLTTLNPWLTKYPALEHIASYVERMLELDPLQRVNLDEVTEAYRHLFDDLGDDKHTQSVYYVR